MATRNLQSEAVVEKCTRCGGEHRHDVSIDLLTETDDGDAAGFAREPYRIAECRGCGKSTRTRLSDA